MKVLMTEWIGFFAGACTTLAFVPQVIQTYKDRSAKNLSLGMYSIFCTGVFFWFIYGYCIQSPSIIAANVVTFLLAGAVLTMKIVFDRNPR